MRAIIMILLFSIFPIDVCLSQHNWNFCLDINKPDLHAQDSFCHAEIDTMPLHTDTTKIKAAEYLNPLTALVYANIPGIIIHGAGHWYARKYLTCTGLFIMSVIGFKLYLWADESVVDEPGYPYRPPDKHYELKRKSGLILWWGTWAYDLIVAPLICIDHNRKVKASLSFRPCLMKNRDRASAGIQLSCSF